MLGGNIFSETWLCALLPCIIILGINAVLSATQIAGIILLFIDGALTYGVQYIFLKKARTGEKMAIEDMVKPFTECYAPTLLISLLTGIFTMLWALLLIVPGFIAAYKYRLALYLLIDRPDLSPMQCILESKRLMSGHKARLFELDISFLLWYLLMCLPVIGYAVQVWVLPQIDVCRAVFYENRLAMERVEAARAAARSAGFVPTAPGTGSAPEDRGNGEEQ